MAGLFADDDFNHIICSCTRICTSITRKNLTKRQHEPFYTIYAICPEYHLSSPNLTLPNNINLEKRTQTHARFSAFARCTQNTKHPLKKAPKEKMQRKRLKPSKYCGISSAFQDESELDTVYSTARVCIACTSQDCAQMPH